MKKAFFFTFLISATLSKAQTIDSIPHIDIGLHSAYPTSVTQLSDSSILGSCFLYDEPSTSTFGALLMYKISRHGGVVLDSFYTEIDYDPRFHLVRQNPFGKDNIFVEAYNDDENGSFNLRILHFDNDLNFDSTNMINVYLDDLHGVCNDPGILLNPQGDIMVSYYEKDTIDDFYNTNTHFALVGLDGTVKRIKSYTPEEIQIDYGIEYGPKVFSETPLRYCQWGPNKVEENGGTIIGLNCYVLDSLFNIEASYSIPTSISYPLGVTLQSNWFTKMHGFDDGNFLVATQYRTSNTTLDNGILIQKFDTDLHRICYAKLQAVPLLPSYVDPSLMPIGLDKGNDGSIFFARGTQGSFAYYDDHLYGQVEILKMDENLNIIWQRYCLEPIGFCRQKSVMKVLDDNSVAIYGTSISLKDNNTITDCYFLVISDDYDALEEQGIIVRPYTYWPNPAQDELHLQFSPDVTPTQIELYDIQGRLVKTQRNGLESINLEGLASGSYTMRVTLKGGKVFSDNVIKE